MFCFCKAFLGIPGVNETLKNIHQSIGFIDCSDHEVGTEVKMPDRSSPSLQLSPLCGKQTYGFCFFA